MKWTESPFFLQNIREMIMVIATRCIGNDIETDKPPVKYQNVS